MQVIHMRCQSFLLQKTMKISQSLLGLFQKKIPRGGGGGEEGKQYIFLWVVGADIFQIIWVIGV